MPNVHVRDGQIILTDKKTGEVLPFDVLQGRLYNVNRAAAVRQFQSMFPHAKRISYGVFRYLDGQIPDYERLDRKKKNIARANGNILDYVSKQAGCEWRLGLWSFDFTQADFWVWDREAGENPYRPWVTAVIDQLAASPVAVVLSKEPPSHYTLRAAILQGVYPKSDVWQICGLPVGLHGDNGLVQHCKWLDDLRRFYPKFFQMDLSLTHSRPAAPQQNAHAESWFSQFKNDFCPARMGAYFPQCYWGHDPKSRPEWFGPYAQEMRVNRKDESWRMNLPTLEQAKAHLVVWIEELLQREPIGEELYGRLGGMTRAQYFAWRRTNYPDEVKLPDDPAAFARILCDKAEGKTVQMGGIVRHLGMEYQADELVERQGERVNLWIDPNDVRQCVVYPEGYGYPICIAYRKGTAFEEKKPLTIFQHLAMVRVKRENQKRRQLIEAIEQHRLPELVAQEYPNVLAMPSTSPSTVKVRELVEEQVDVEERFRQRNKILQSWR